MNVLQQLGNLFGLVLFCVAVFFAVKMIRDRGKSNLADWLRQKWPPKK